MKVAAIPPTFLKPERRKQRQAESTARHSAERVAKAIAKAEKQQVKRELLERRQALKATRDKALGEVANFYSEALKGLYAEWKAVRKEIWNAWRTGDDKTLKKAGRK